jgi:hypothetical protein
MSPSSQQTRMSDLRHTAACRHGGHVAWRPTRRMLGACQRVAVCPQSVTPGIST